MDLIIIRHGRPERDEREEHEGTADPELSELGRQQAEATGAFLLDEDIHHIAASPMRRAHQTALPLAGLRSLEVELVEGLREADHYSSSYVPEDELTPDHEMYRLFTEDPMAIFEPHGGVDAFQQTVVDSFEYLIQSNAGRRVAVFCHGMVMGVYLRSMLGHRDPYKLTADYCGIMRVKASSSGIRSVASVNETAHVRHLL
ncbi:MAG: histidine phosphatase family protein [Acidimicrobiia bacterium]|nr:histidine phosphatase family protein [Acidimicrobiia bacterium]MDH5238038.1 histidine phosphatase family protein [Acidimicrobiia bacterium]